jgi:hypothetical protein
MFYYLPIDCNNDVIWAKWKAPVGKPSQSTLLHNNTRGEKKTRHGIWARATGVYYNVHL